MTTQPHPEPSEEASSLPVQLWAAGDEAGNVAWDRGWKFSPIERPEAKIALVRLSDAQSQLNAIRVERDEARAERDIEAAARSALKAKQIDVDAVMRLAEVYAAQRAMFAKQPVMTYEGDLNAAREALRASLASPEGRQK